MTNRDFENDLPPAQTILNAGLALAEPQEVADGLVTVVVPDGGTLNRIDVNAHLDQYADRPRRKRGTVHVQSSGSFVEYVAKHGLDQTEVWADPARQALVGVINAHAASDTACDEGVAGHGDHRVALELVHTPAWLAWAKLDKQWMGQQQFAEHIEDNVLDVTSPDGATMLEIAQSFHATTGVTFKSAQRLHSGEATLHYEEDTGAKAGVKGDLDIPTQFTLSLQPYCGQDNFLQLTARFRYRIRGGELSLSYALNQADVHLRSLFDDVVDEVRIVVPQPVYYGRPA